MSWAEEQSWFGLEDLAMNTLREQEENGYYIALIDYRGHKEYLIDYPFDSIEKARREIFTYRNICKKAKIYHGKPY